jgi:hypothetical protein
LGFWLLKSVLSMVKLAKRFDGGTFEKEENLFGRMSLKK